MTVKDILKSACALLGFQESTIANGTTETEAKFLRAFNMIIGELAENYRLFKKTERVIFNHGTALYTAFSEKVVSVKSVKDENYKYSFREEPTGVFADVGQADVTYYYSPSEYAISDEVVLPERLSKRIVALGVASEYALYSERYEESIKFNDKYMDAVERSSFSDKEIKIKPRKWFI